MQISSELSISEVRILSLASIGGALEFYDFVIFVFFANVIGKLFFAASLPEWVRQAQTFGIFAVGYLARPLGGIVTGSFILLRLAERARFRPSTFATDRLAKRYASLGIRVCQRPRTVS